MNKPHLYVNQKGFYVTRHSYSGSESYTHCPRKYYLERVQGWRQIEQRSSTEFGKALENAITFWHQRGQDTDAAVAEFNRQWAECENKPLTYTKEDKDWERLSLTGQEMVRLYTILYPDMPYVVDNPDFSFQVEKNIEMFPDSKLAGISLTMYLDMVVVFKETGNRGVVDMKTSGKEVPEFTELDPQLRTYGYGTGYQDVAFLWFRKMGRTISCGDEVTLITNDLLFKAGTKGTVLGKDVLGGIWITLSESVAEGLQQFEGKSKDVVEARQKYVEANGILVDEKNLTKQRIYFKHVVLSVESMEDIGRSIKRDILSIVRSNELDFWPMQSGVRFPHDKCTKCEMRGICADRPALRDSLVERKVVDDLELIQIEERE